MKLTAILLVVFCLKVSASVYGQGITLKVSKVTLEKVLTEIKKQSGYSFWYDDQVMRDSKPVSLEIRNASLKEVLDFAFANQPLSYIIADKTIIVKKKENQKVPISNGVEAIDISGRVTDENGEPLVGATVKVKGTNQTTATDVEGSFNLKNVTENTILQVSFIGYEPKEVALRNDIIVTLAKSSSKLDEVQVIAYGTTTKRLNTGSVATITAAEIAKQPVSNPLAALSGRIPGLVVTQSTGVPGSSFNLQIRGRNSIAQGSQPLILIDGIPFAPGNEGVNTMSSALSDGIAGSSLSPLYSINPSDIESIDVLKDADATAIYGSRGANGVILITTRKGQIGKTQVSANVNRGITQVGKTMEMMNTEQYLEMRREAFKNSNLTPTNINAPDLVIWDGSRYTDYKEDLIGNTGQLTNAQLSFSGGSKNLQFLLGGAYYRETNVFPGDLPNTRGSMNVNLNHKSADNRFSVTFSGNYSDSENNVPSFDLTQYTFVSPNTPSFFDENGNLKWQEAGIEYYNPYSLFLQKYNAKTNNLTSSLNAAFQLFPSLRVKAAVGYNRLNGSDMVLSPKASLSPSSTQISSSKLGNTQFAGWNIEPQLEYIRPLWKGKLEVLMGATLHQKTNNSSYYNLSGFPSDALLQSVAAASSVIAKSNSYSLYRYQALFGRINYNIDDKYLLNITGRRDGSSRFGSGRQFANFGAVGAAWIFSAEDFFKDKIPALSFGKLRASYGITGNDQIGDYNYLDAWAAYHTSYQGTTALAPNNLFNADYGWEENKKLELAIDLGFWKDRVLLSVNYYQNRSGNQLVSYRLPYMTGFGFINSNFPAVVENKGWEMQLNSQVLAGRGFKWDTSLNLTLPSNTLLAFPDIASSTYATAYVVGQPLNLIFNYQSLGVGPATGLYSFNDVNGNGSMTSADILVNGNLDPKYYGGFRNTFNYKGLELDLFLDYRKQLGLNYLSSIYRNTTTPGSMLNQPVALLNRWQKPGDETNIEKYLAVAASNRTNVNYSNQIYDDASFIRLRNLAFSYSIPEKMLSSIKVTNARIYLQGQNLLIWNRQKGYDPETQNLYRLPPLRTYTLGIQCTL